MIAKAELEKFREIWLKETQEELNDSDLLKRAEALLTIVFFLLKKEKLPDAQKKTI